jgi:hypothetical protein
MTTERAVSGEPIPFRRLVRVGNPLARSRGEVAVYLAGQGFALVPCHWPLQTGENPVCSCSLLPPRYRENHSTEKGRKRIGKHPYGRFAPRWKDDATNDPEVVREWLDGVPDLNFGLVTGLAHTVVVEGRERELFLVVIDADSRQATNQLQADVDMPKSLDVLTGRGMHLYYWTDQPMKGSNRLLGIPNVDVRGAGGYVMAAGSLHASGVIYTPRGRLEDISMASDDLRGHLVLAAESASRKRGSRPRITLGQDNVIGIGTARSELPIDIPDDLLPLLNHDPEVGQRSEPEFLALRRLTALSDDDLDVLDTLTAFPIGKRLYEKALDEQLAEVQRARDFPDTPEGQAAHFLQKQQKLVEEQWEASQGLPATTRKVLYGFQMISLERKGRRFTAPLAEVAIHAGVEKVTVLRHRTILLEEGWLCYVHQAQPGERYASTYVLHVPTSETTKADISEPLLTGMDGGIRMSSLGAGSSGPNPDGGPTSAAGEKSPRTSMQKSPPVDLSSDSARWKTTTTLWGVLPYVTEERTVPELARMTGKSVRQVRRITARLLELRLIADRRHIKLVDDWRKVWDNLAEIMGTAGKKEAAERRLADERLARKRLRLVQEGKAVAFDGYVVTDDGEIV